MSVQKRPRKDTNESYPLISWDNGSKQPIYVPTEEDRLWLLRAVEGEGPVHNEVAQVLVNRFLYLRARIPNAYTTLAELVQAYSQPVNPLWMRGGEKWDSAWAKAKTPEERAKLREIDAKRRDHRSRLKFSPNTVSAVERALTKGSLDIDGRAVHFAAPKKGRKALPVLTQPERANWLHTEAPAENWQGYRSSAEPAISAASGAGAGALVGVVLVGLMLGRGK